MIHDENDVLTDDELAIARNFLKNQNMHACTYKMNFLVGLSCWIIYEVIILSESKKGSLNAAIIP